MEIVDLSQEIYTNMPVHHTQPPVSVEVHVTHEQWEGEDKAGTGTPAVNTLHMSEHAGTHVDALSHMGKAYSAHSIETMSLERFITRGICIDLSDKNPGDLIVIDDLKNALVHAQLVVAPGDTVLLYTDHYRQYHATEHWANNPGLSEEACRWLGEEKVSAFGVESMAPGVKGLSNKAVHRICGEMGFTHYENLINLHLLIGKGPFRFIGLPLKIRGGTGSPVRAVALFE